MYCFGIDAQQAINLKWFKTRAHYKKIYLELIIFIMCANIILFNIPVAAPCLTVGARFRNLFYPTLERHSAVVMYRYSLTYFYGKRLRCININAVFDKIFLNIYIYISKYYTDITYR